jgi:hypothetical protein
VTSSQDTLCDHRAIFRDRETMVYTWTCCMLRSPHETLGVLFLSAWEVAVLPALVLPGFYVREPGAEEPHGLLKCRTMGEGSMTAPPI